MFLLQLLKIVFLFNFRAEAAKWIIPLYMKHKYFSSFFLIFIFNFSILSRKREYTVFVLPWLVQQPKQAMLAQPWPGENTNRSTYYDSPGLCPWRESLWRAGASMVFPSCGARQPQHVCARGTSVSKGAEVFYHPKLLDVLVLPLKERVCCH